MSLSTRRLLLVVAPLALALAACSSGTGASEAPADAPSAAPPSAVASEAPAAADATVSLSDTSLGTVLVDAEGMTLYAFTPDTDGVSTCYDDCAAAWPPLVVDGAPAAGEGLDASLLTTVERTDGTTQAKYGDWPLYTFASDSAPGDVTGQGVGGKWYVIAADGSLIGQGTGIRDY
jgi:predicted lipoprotein with Yx(FWY)xxD motif